MADSAATPKKPTYRPTVPVDTRVANRTSIDRLDRIRMDMVKHFHELTEALDGAERRVLANMIIEDLKVASTDWGGEMHSRY